MSIPVLREAPLGEGSVAKPLRPPAMTPRASAAEVSVGKRASRLSLDEEGNINEGANKMPVLAEVVLIEDIGEGDELNGIISQSGLEEVLEATNLVSEQIVKVHRESRVKIAEARDMEALKANAEAERAEKRRETEAKLPNIGPGGLMAALAAAKEQRDKEIRKEEYEFASSEQNVQEAFLSSRGIRGQLEESMLKVCRPMTSEGSYELMKKLGVQGDLFRDFMQLHAYARLKRTTAEQKIERARPRWRLPDPEEIAEEDVEESEEEDQENAEDRELLDAFYPLRDEKRKTMLTPGGSSAEVPSSARKRTSQRASSLSRSRPSETHGTPEGEPASRRGWRGSAGRKASNASSGAQRRTSSGRRVSTESESRQASMGSNLREDFGSKGSGLRRRLPVGQRGRALATTEQF